MSNNPFNPSFQFYLPSIVEKPMKEEDEELKWIDSLMKDEDMSTINNTLNINVRPSTPTPITSTSNWQNRQFFHAERKLQTDKRFDFSQKIIIPPLSQIQQSNNNLITSNNNNNNNNNLINSMSAQNDNSSMQID